MSRDEGENGDRNEPPSSEPGDSQPPGRKTVRAVAFLLVLASPAFLALLMTLVVHLYGLASRAQARRRRREQEHAEAARQVRRRCDRLLGLSGVVLILEVLLARGPWRLEGAPALLAAAFGVWLLGELPRLRGEQAAAALPAAPVEGGWLRSFRSQVPWDVLQCKPSTRHGVPPILLTLMLALTASSVTSVTGIPVNKVLTDGMSGNITQAIADFRSSGRDREGTYRWAHESAPVKTAEARHTALPESPCRSGDARRLFLSGPGGIGEASFDAWRRVGGAVIGCPEGAPVQSGAVYVSALLGGQDAPAEVIADGSGGAAVVFSDFYALINAELHGVDHVDARLSFGIGTNQLVHFTDRTCRLAHRYYGDLPVLLPAAVTMVVLDIAANTGDMPRLIVSLPVQSGNIYDFELVAPRASGGTRTVQSIVVMYSNGSAQWRRYTGNDGRPCPPTSKRLLSVSDNLERTTHQ